MAIKTHKRVDVGDFTGMWDPQVQDSSGQTPVTWSGKLCFVSDVAGTCFLMSQVQAIFLLPVLPPHLAHPKDVPIKWCISITSRSAQNSLTILNLSIYLPSLLPVVTSLQIVLCEKLLSWIQKCRAEYLLYLGDQQICVLLNMENH